MTEEDLRQILRQKIEEEPCATLPCRQILLHFKNDGGKQETAQRILEQLALIFAGNEMLQDQVYDILDFVVGWCCPQMDIWEDVPADLKDGLYFEGDPAGVVFNHYSFCELIKHIMVRWGNTDYETAGEKLNNSHLAKVPQSFEDVCFLTHELEFHWAMLLAHGSDYWTKGIPADFNNFKEVYLAWEAAVQQQAHLKDSYEFYQKP